MGPLLLWMSVPAQVTSATTAMMSLLASAANVVQYGVDGEIPWSIALWFLLFGTLGGFLGRSTAIYITRRYNRPSVTVFALSFVLITSTVLMIYEMVAHPPDMNVADACS